MSDLMLEAVIRMPYEMAMQSELSRHQYYDRANQALDEMQAYAEARVREAQQWQPIETAPKDGAEILLFRDADVYDGKPVPPRVTSGAWTEWTDTASEYHSTTGEYLGQSVQDSGAEWLSWDGGFSEEMPPTHWMPLPSPPTDAAMEAKDE